MRSLGIGREERKLFVDEGTVDEEENSRLYEVTLPWHSNGDW